MNKQEPAITKNDRLKCTSKEGGEKPRWKLRTAVLVARTPRASFRRKLGSER